MKPRIVLQFIVTAREKRRIERAAKREKRSVSEFLRAAAADRISLKSRVDVDPRVGV